MQERYGLEEKSGQKCVRRRCMQRSWVKPGRRTVSVFVEKFVVVDGRWQLVKVFGFVNRVFGTNQPSLTEHTTDLLSGDFFWHLEDQCHQRIWLQLMRDV